MGLWASRPRTYSGIEDQDFGGQELNAFPTPRGQTRNSDETAVNDRLPSAERRSKIVFWPIIVLCSGIVLEICRFGPTGHLQSSSAVPQLAEYVYAEYFDIACMSIAIIWILAMAVNVSRNPPDGQRHKGQVFPLALLGIFGIIGGVALSFLQALSFFVYPCSTDVGKAYALMKIVFILTQVILIIYYKRKSAIMNRTVINGSLLYHTVVCNVVLYIRTFIESKGDFRVSDDPTSTPMLTVLISNTTPTINCSSKYSDIISIYRDLSPYLYPFFLEFTLTASAMLAEIWLEDHDNHANNRVDESYPSDISLRQTSNRPHYRKLTPIYPHLVFITTIAAAVGLGVYLHVNSNASGYGPATTLYSFRTAIAILMIIACIVGCSSTNGKSRQYKGGFDEVLLVIGSLGVFAFAAVEVVASLACLTSEDKHGLVGDAAFALAENGFWVIEAALQTTFLTRALHREVTVPRAGSKCAEAMHTAKLTFLLFLFNLLMWIIDTVHVEGHVKGVYAHTTLTRINALENQYIGKTYWDYTFLVIYPLRIFFRIHSAALFFRAYNLHKRVPDEIPFRCIVRARYC